jgi:hypothetical protein
MKSIKLAFPKKKTANGSSRNVMEICCFILKIKELTRIPWGSN